MTGLLCLPELSLAWRHDFSIDDHQISAAFAGAPETSFVIASRDMDDAILFGLGVTFINSSNLGMYVKYEGEKRTDFLAQKISGGLRFEF